SWHGLPEPVTCPPHMARNSLAVYYLCEPRSDAADRGRALYAPHGDQANDPKILELIKLRSQVTTSHNVYRTNDDKEKKKFGSEDDVLRGGAPPQLAFYRP